MENKSMEKSKERKSGSLFIHLSESTAARSTDKIL